MGGGKPDKKTMPKKMDEHWKEIKQRKGGVCAWVNNGLGLRRREENWKRRRSEQLRNGQAFVEGIWRQISLTAGGFVSLGYCRLRSTITLCSLLKSSTPTYPALQRKRVAAYHKQKNLIISLPPVCICFCFCSSPRTGINIHRLP